MEKEKKASKLPLSLVALDAIGTIFLGLGIAKMFVGVDILPATFQLNDKGWTFIIIGILLMMPIIMHFIVKLREQAEEKLKK